MPARSKISFFLLFCFSLLLWHDLVPHHHAVGSDEDVSISPDHHADNDHIHYFSNFHTSHPASTTSEIIHFQYQQTRPLNQIALIPAILPEKTEFSPPELLEKPLKTNQSVIPIIEGITLSCGLRAPPIA